MKIILDTNFLLIPAQFKVDIFSELDKLGTNQLYILDRTLEELTDIVKKQSLKNKKAAKLALSLIKFKKIKIIKTKTTNKTDDLIVEIAKKKKNTVATQDKLLKQKLNENKVKIITLRQKKYLIMC